MPGLDPGRRVRLAALAALSLPMLGGLLLLSPGRAEAATPTATITCPKADGSAGGVTVEGTNHTCEAVTGNAAALVVGAAVTRDACVTACPVTLVVTDPDGNQFKAERDVQDSATWSVTVAHPVPGSYVARLSGTGVDVRTGFEVTAPTTAPPTSASTAAGSGSSAASPGSAAPPAPTASTAPTSAAVVPPSGPRGGGGGVLRFPVQAPPAGIAALPPLPSLPGGDSDGAPVAGPYGKTLPYDGSVTVTTGSGQPSVLGHVADTFDNEQVAASIAAACLALLVVAHLLRLLRRPAADADL